MFHYFTSFKIEWNIFSFIFFMYSLKVDSNIFQQFGCSCVNETILKDFCIHSTKALLFSLLSPLFTHLFTWIHTISNKWSKRSMQFKNADETMNVTFYGSLPGAWVDVRAVFISEYQIPDLWCAHHIPNKETKTIIDFIFVYNGSFPTGHIN